MVLLAMLMAGCRSGQWTWVDEPVPFAPVAAKCRGGTINTERRTTDSSLTGRTRVTTTRTDACID